MGYYDFQTSDTMAGIEKAAHQLFSTMSEERCLKYKHHEERRGPCEPQHNEKNEKRKLYVDI